MEIEAVLRTGTRQVADQKALLASADIQRARAREFASRLQPKLLIGSDWKSAVSGEELEVRDPATEEVIGYIASGDVEDVDLAVAAARAAFERRAWIRLGAASRGRTLYAVADAIERNQEEFAALETIDNGMPLTLARSFVTRSADAFRYYAGWCDKLPGGSPDLNVGDVSYHGVITQHPVGVAGLIVPWNGPLTSASLKIATALAAGCSVVLKPAEDASLSSLRLGQIILEAGVPPGVVNIVTGLGSRAGAALAAHSDVDKIAFTGSTAVGRLILAAAAGNLKRVSLELGGKSPVIVCPDADLKAAAAGVSMGTFLNSGQMCIAGSRAYVHRSILPEFIAEMREFAQGVSVGSGFNEASMLGPLISQRQRSRVQSLVDNAVTQGSIAEVGGKVRQGSGYYFEPTILTNVRPTDPILREEIFGPVITVIPFDDENAVIADANDTPYGLAAAIWTRDLSTAHRLSRAVDAGVVWVNCQLVLPHGMPFGGFKQSGWGAENDYSSLEGYLKTKSTIIKL